jgi:1-acyl-sn-glycerol-3-phosphate acyltransferase
MINRFQPALVPIKPAFRPWVLATLQSLLPLLLRLRIFAWLPAAISRIEVEGEDKLVRCWHRFGTGQVRLILAFRHVEVDDPLVGLHLLSRVLPDGAARLGLSLPAPLHAHFLFDRGMTLWAGRPLGWLLASLGGVSLRRGRQPDWTALRQARQLVLTGRFPFAVAPEGATNGHSERIGPLESGVAQLGLWCVDDLRQAGRDEEVLMVPIAIQYTYGTADWERLAALMARLETTIGLPAPERSGTADPYGRLLRIGEGVLDRLECHYGRHGPLPLTGIGAGHHLEKRPSSEPGNAQSPTPSIGPTPGVDDQSPRATEHPALSSLERRIELLRNRCLSLAETYFGCPSSGTAEQRCRRIEEQSWRWIYREDLPPRPLLSPLDRALADQEAHGAALAALPMRLAETFVAVSGTYVAERPSFERFMETTLLIGDALARLGGEGLPARPRLGARRARISIGEPISVTARAQGRDKGERHQLLASLNDSLRQELERALI